MRRLDPIERYGLRLTLLAVAIVLVVVPFSTLLFQVLGDGSLTRFDGDVADSLNDAVHGRRWWLRTVEVVTWIGSGAVLWCVAIAACAWAWRRGARKLAAFLAATSGGGFFLSTVIKVLVDRPRPVVDHPVADAFGRSFPSGHALGSTVVLGAVLLAFLPLVPRAARRLAVTGTAALVLAIGASRLLLGVHFVTDVVAGHVLGLAWLAGSTALFETWRIERGRPGVAPLSDGVEPEEADALAP